jgi:hypothetical protein
VRRFAAAFLLAALLTLVLAHAASAATITVTTTSDETATDGSVSLREAIQSIDAGANVNPDVVASGVYGTNDTIVVPASTSHYAVSAGELSITKPVVIQGASAAGTIIDAGGASRVFHLTSGVGNSGTVTFQGLTIMGGNVTVAPGGGGVLTDSGSGFLEFVNTTVSGNTASFAATGYSQGGGGVFSAGNTLTLTNSAFSGNTTTITTASFGGLGGGAVYQRSADLMVSNSTLSGNTATVTGNGSNSSGGNGGGAIYQRGGVVSVNNGTLTGNITTVTATRFGCCTGGGAIFNDGSRSGQGVVLYGSTIGGPGAAANTATLGTSGSPLASCCYGGGGIYNDNANVAITASTLSSNATTVYATSCCSGGGALFQDDNDIALTNSVLSGNLATVTSNNCCNGGGAFYNDGSNQFTSGSTLTGNSLTVNGTGSRNGGGAYFNDGSGDSLTASTVSGNTAHFGAVPTNSGGGGMFEDGSGASFSNSTISDNSTDVPAGTNPGGGGIYLDSNGTSVFANTTIAGNSAPNAPGGGVLNYNATLRSTDTIIAQNSSGSGGGANCATAGSGTFTSLGYNLEDFANSCSFTGPGDIVASGSTVGLGPLQNNGGPTPTRALLAGSPAIEGGNPSGCTDAFGSPLTTDQRSVARADRCDIGAYEFAGPLNTTPPVISGIALPGQTLTCSTGTWAGSPILSYHFQWNRDGVAIAGANSSGYTIATSDAGHQLTCTVTATNAEGSASATSAAVPVATPGAGGCMNPASPAVDLLGTGLRVASRSRIITTPLRNRNACLIVGNAQLTLSGSGASAGAIAPLVLTTAVWLPANTQKTLYLFASNRLLQKLSANRRHRLNVTIVLTLQDISAHSATVKRSYTLQGPKPPKRRVRHHR